HEYGGGDYVVHGDDIYFSNFSDQRLYVQRDGGLPEAITPAENVRYADPIVDVARERLICVREDHREPGREAVNCLVSLKLAGNQDTGEILVSGNDFYSSPRISPDGSR